MNLVGSRGIWGFVLGAAGSFLKLQALGVFGAGELAWSAVFGAAGLGVSCAPSSGSATPTLAGGADPGWTVADLARLRPRAEAQAGRVGRTCRRRSS